jgi:phenylacetate-CoA ligase
VDAVGFLKSVGLRCPGWLGVGLAHIPYSWKPAIGRLYRSRCREIRAFERLSESDRRGYIFQRVSRVVEYAAANVPFYKGYYADSGFSVSRLKSFEHIQEIPVVTKAVLQQYALEARSCARKGRYLANTGGSSGEPLSFYIEPQSVAHEWAHMHLVWAKLGYRPWDLKLAFVGRSDAKDPVHYDAVRNHYWVNIFIDTDKVGEALRKVIHKKRIRYLHGYPSAIYDFAVFCDECASDLLGILRGTLAGVLLGSEYPAPQYRDKIESVFRVPSVSWYGHTERSILAYEKERRYLYRPFQTYGYCEAVPDDSSRKFMLVGTSYHNMASPFIRYWTGDLVKPGQRTGGLLEGFEIEDGRSGEFIFDRSLNRVSLTGLIFGRHHSGFDLASSVQVEQSIPGKAKILVCPLSGRHKSRELEWSSLFDLSGVAVDFEFEEVDGPIRTKAGKVNLLVRRDLQTVAPGGRGLES